MIGGVPKDSAKSFVIVVLLPVCVMLSGADSTLARSNEARDCKKSLASAKTKDKALVGSENIQIIV